MLSPHGSSIYKGYPVLTLSDILLQDRATVTDGNVRSCDVKFISLYVGSGSYAKSIVGYRNAVKLEHVLSLSTCRRKIHLWVSSIDPAVLSRYVSPLIVK